MDGKTSLILRKSSCFCSSSSSERSSGSMNIFSRMFFNMAGKKEKMEGRGRSGVKRKNKKLNLNK